MARRLVQGQGKEKDNDRRRIEVEAFAPKIISASRRTDIPAFFADQFIENWGKGHFLTQNRYGAKAYISVENTRCVVFWTKNPGPLLNRLDDFDKFGVNYYFQFTLNDYEQEGFEPNVPSLEDRIETFVQLSNRIGKKRVVWRFDPLVVTNNITKEMLVEKVFSLAEQLAGHTEKLVISFLDLEKHKNVKTRLEKVRFRNFSEDEIKFVASRLGEISNRFGIKVATCREDDLSEYGVEKNKCIDDGLMRHVFKEDALLMNFLDGGQGLKDAGQSKACGCIVSKDIGTYNTCRHFCLYCYATSSKPDVDQSQVTSKSSVKKKQVEGKKHKKAKLENVGRQVGLDEAKKLPDIPKKADDWSVPMGGKLTWADCLDYLPHIPDNAVDLIVTDPPYGYKFMGKDWDKTIPSVEIWKECLRVLKPGGFACIMSAPRQDLLSRMIASLEEAGFETNFTSLYWAYASGFSKRYNTSKGMDKRAGVAGKVVPDFKAQDTPDDNCGQAKQFDGAYAGFQPKPAVEIILVVKKPNNEKTSIDQVIHNGKGVTWLDDCRIPYVEKDEPTSGNRTATFGRQKTVSGGDGSPTYKPNKKGRVPANLLVSDDVLDEHLPGQRGMGEYIELDEKTSIMVKGPDGTGGFSRFFSLDAWVEKRLPFLIVPKPSKREKNSGLKTKNFHPTVKPIQLMAYLIEMGSREGDIVLDPFCGTGSTCLAAFLMNRRGLGIEKEDEYIRIAFERHRSLLLETEYGIKN